MRLIEIKDKVRNTRIPKVIYNALWEREVDTIDIDSIDGKYYLVDQMQRAIDAGKVFKVPLSTESKKYLLTTALPNLIRIANHNMDQKLLMALKSFQARMNAKLSGAD
jgi:hypothetical protein